MRQNLGLIAVLIVAAAGTLWFRRRPLSLRQRLAAAGIAIVLLAIGILAQRGGVTIGRLIVVIGGAAILAAAARYTGDSGEGPDGDGTKI